MVPGHSSRTNMYQLSNIDKETLRKIAQDSILSGLDNRYLKIDKSKLSNALKEKKASFVTLTYKNQPEEKNLRGCIGSIIPDTILAEDVANNAYNAAFRDPRFPSLRKEEFPYIDIKISVLSPLEILQVRNFEDLFNKIEPFKDGIYLKTREGSATFLPEVWKKIPDKEKFILELFKKAHLPNYYDFLSIKWYRYRTETF